MRSTKRLTLCCICAACLAFLPQLASAAAPLPISIDMTYVDVTASPGDHLEKSFKFWNGTDAFLLVHLEAADFAAQGEEGQIQVGGEEDAANSLKAWVTPELSDVAVAPKENITLPFSIDVPVNADPGSHWGTLLTITAPQGGGSGVGVEAALGFIIYVRVPGDMREEVSVESFSAPRFVEAPPFTVETRFRNEGTVHEAPAGLIEVRNMFGSLVATGTLPVRNVLPGAVRRISASVGSGTWFGRYAVTLRAAYGDNGDTLSASAYVWAVPWKTYGPWVFGMLAILAVILLEPKRVFLALRILITGKPPQLSSGRATSAADQTV